MKEIQYKTFSFKTHKKNWQIRKPNVCQFEFTFGCDLHCRHCYTDCYNKPSFLKRELNTEQVKFILDKVYQAGVIWLCFTGGDPLTRPDFLELYSYAKNKGFIISIFTNGYSMTKRIADYLKEKPPFVIEMTLNGATKETYEKISGIEGSFEKTMQGINLILERRLPLKIKTQAIKDNLEELPEIKELIESLGLNFRPSVFLHARLNGDLAPCALRIKPEEVLNLNGKKESIENDCVVPLEASRLAPRSRRNRRYPYLFRCTIGGGDGLYLDPYANLVPCDCIREPKASLLKDDINEAQNVTLEWVRSRAFITNTKCKNCSIRESCYNCPGKALLERQSLEKPVEWFCKVAHLERRNNETRQ